MQIVKSKALRLLRLLVAVAAASAALAVAAYAGPHPPAPLPYDAAQLQGPFIVKYSGTFSPSRLLAAAGWRAEIAWQIPQLGIVQLRPLPGSERAVVSALQRDPAVQYVEVDHRAHALDLPNDPRWPEQWALARVGAPSAWDIARGQGTVVAVLDTGVFLEHPDLQPTLWTNAGEVPGNGIDDDGNGKADDVHGWHFYQNCSTGTCEPYENPVLDDDNGHGTHVTGIIAAATDNGIGIASLSWGAQAMIVKVLDEAGDGYYSDIAKAIVYAVENGASVINLSLGGEEPSQLLQDAVDYAYGEGVLLVAAAGNDGGSVLYPAACDNVVAVAATDASDGRASFSNQGPQVDIAAPGVDIVSTWPWLDGYYRKQGTSMAAAQVSAAAALLWSHSPDFTNRQVQQRLEAQSEDVNASVHPGHDPYLGWGLLNAYRALHYVCYLAPVYRGYR